MSEGKRTCQKPEKLVDKPQKCSPEQIKNCHGSVKSHPCVKQAKRK